MNFSPDRSLSGDNPQPYFWIGGIKYYASSEKEARKMHRKYLADERKKITLMVRQERERQAAENAKFQGLSFLEGFKLAKVELAEQRALGAEKMKTEWAKDYTIYTNPDQLCCYCGTSIPTKRIWFFDRHKRKVLAVIGLDGQVVRSENWHPHVSGTNICIGGDSSVDGARALFLGLNPGSAFHNVKDWLAHQLGHSCWWNSVLPHQPDHMTWSTQSCGCRKCSYCTLPLCKCTANLLSRQYPINHPIPPMTRQAFDELVKWAESARKRYNWDEKTTIFNANYIASLPVELLTDSPITTTLPVNEESIEGGSDHDNGPYPGDRNFVRPEF